MSSGNTHKERKTDGYSRLLRDLDRLVRWSKDGRWEDVDEVHNEMREWILSQIELSETMSARGKTGGINSGESRRSSASTSASTKDEAVLQPVLEAESDLASSNKVINKENELRKGNPPTPLTAYGNQNPYGAFEAKLDGKPERIAEYWAMAYKDEYRARPAIGNYEKKIILEDLAEYDENALKLAFKAFLADKWHRDNKRHSLKVFAADPTKWLNPAIAEANKPYDLGNDDEYWEAQAREQQIALAATLKAKRPDLDAELERLTSDV